jgi:hypothetical protein
MPGLAGAAESPAVTPTPPPGVAPGAWDLAAAPIRSGMARLTAVIQRSNRSQIEVAAVLVEAERARWAEALGFDSVEALAATVFGTSRRKTRTLIALYMILVERLHVSLDLLAPVPWTKLAAILPVVAPDTVGAWLRRAQDLPLRLLTAEVRQQRRGQAAMARLTKAFSIPAEAEAVIELALERIGQLANTDDRGRQLEFLAAEALAGMSPGLAPSGHCALVVYLPVVAYQRFVAALAATGQPTLDRSLMALIGELDPSAVRTVAGEHRRG